MKTLEEELDTVQQSLSYREGEINEAKSVIDSIREAEADLK